MIPRLRLRTVGTRATRSDPRERRLESLAGEFALLTQRRARTMHQLDLLDQQRTAAAMNLHKVQARLAWLVQSMDALEGFSLHEPAPAPEPEARRAEPPARPVPPVRMAPGIGQSGFGQSGSGRSGSGQSGFGQGRLRVAGAAAYQNPGLGSSRSETSRRQP